VGYMRVRLEVSWGLTELYAAGKVVVWYFWSDLGALKERGCVWLQLWLCCGLSW